MDNQNFLRRILWITECRNEHLYADVTSHCTKEVHIQPRFSINVRMGIINYQIIRPYFINGNVTSAEYSAFLTQHLDVLLDDVPFNIRTKIIFQQNGHPAHRTRSCQIF